MLGQGVGSVGADKGGQTEQGWGPQARTSTLTPNEMGALEGLSAGATGDFNTRKLESRNAAGSAEMSCREGKCNRAGWKGRSGERKSSDFLTTL